MTKLGPKFGPKRVILGQIFQKNEKIFKNNFFSIWMILSRKKAKKRWKFFFLSKLVWHLVIFGQKMRILEFKEFWRFHGFDDYLFVYAGLCIFFGHRSSRCMLILSFILSSYLSFYLSIFLSFFPNHYHPLFPFFFLSFLISFLLSFFLSLFLNHLHLYASPTSRFLVLIVSWNVLKFAFQSPGKNGKMSWKVLKCPEIWILKSCGHHGKIKHSLLITPVVVNTNGVNVACSG